MFPYFPIKLAIVFPYVSICSHMFPYVPIKLAIVFPYVSICSHMSILNWRFMDIMSDTPRIPQVYDHFNNLCRENAISVVRAFRQAEQQCPATWAVGRNVRAVVMLCKRHR